MEAGKSPDISSSLPNKSMRLPIGKLAVGCVFAGITKRIARGIKKLF